MTVCRNNCGSKYVAAGTGLAMLPATAKKSVTCCSHFVAVPSALYTGVVVVILLGVVEIFSKRPLLADEV